LFKKEDTFLPKLRGYVKSVIDEQDMDSLTLRKVRRQRVRESARATKDERASALLLGYSESNSITRSPVEWACCRWGGSACWRQGARA